RRVVLFPTQHTRFPRDCESRKSSSHVVASCGSRESHEPDAGSRRRSQRQPGISGFTSPWCTMADGNAFNIWGATAESVYPSADVRQFHDVESSNTSGGFRHTI